MRKNGCRAPLTFTLLTLAIEHKFVNEQKKWRGFFLTSSQAKLKSDPEAHMTIACTISTQCSYMELRFLNVRLMTLLYIFP